MKHIIGRLTAVSAAAITAFSMMTAAGLTAEALSTNNWISSTAQLSTLRNTNSSSLGYGFYTENDQYGLPKFAKVFLNSQSSIDVAVKPTSNYGRDLRFFGLLDTNIAWRLADVAQVRAYVDKFAVKNQSGQYFSVQLVYGANNIIEELEGETTPVMYDYGMRLFEQGSQAGDPMSGMRLENYTYNSSTGVYSGDFVRTGYIAGTRLSCSDGLTTFSTPVLRKVAGSDYDFESVIHFSGKVQYPNQGEIRFNTGIANGDYQILTNLKATYSGGHLTTATTNQFKKTISKAEMNNTYNGMLTDSTLKTVITGYNKTNFNNKNFVAAKTSGNILYICIGQNIAGHSCPQWNNGTGLDKLNGFLSTGGKDAFKHNTWLVNWLNSHNSSNYTVKFMYNATKTGTGTQMYQCTPSVFKTMLGI